MDPQKLLSSLAADRGLPLSGLVDASTKYAKSTKIACCGGVMTRVVTESSADSTVLLRDGSGSCYCALHGEITSRYPDVLTAGALLLFTDVTLLVLSSKVPPVLMACLPNLAGLLLPEEPAASSALPHEIVKDQPMPERPPPPLPMMVDATGGHSWQINGLREDSESFFLGHHCSDNGGNDNSDSQSGRALGNVTVPFVRRHVGGDGGEVLGGQPFASTTAPATVSGRGAPMKEEEAIVRAAEGSGRTGSAVSLVASPPRKVRRPEVRTQQGTTVGASMSVSAVSTVEVDAEDDEGCLELVDDL